MQPLLIEYLIHSPSFSSSQPATSCNSTAYPVVNYIISISGLAGNVSVPHTEGESVSITLTTSDFPGLVDDAYTVNVMACAAFACRLAQPVSVGQYYKGRAGLTRSVLTAVLPTQ